MTVARLETVGTEDSFEERYGDAVPYLPSAERSCEPALVCERPSDGLRRIVLDRCAIEVGATTSTLFDPPPRGPARSPFPVDALSAGCVPSSSSRT